MPPDKLTATEPWSHPSGPSIRIGTRGSPLALAQAQEVAERLSAAHGLDRSRFEILPIRTSGDRIQDRPLAEAGGKGLFTKEIEEALLEGRIDLAVHSMKDMPTLLPAGLAVAAILPREDPRDAFISARWSSLDELPGGARVGTSSLRRAAQVRRNRPDLSIVALRGNVETRLRKIGEGVAEATFLAIAGLNRLGLADRVTAAVPESVMLPAVAQGAIGIEIRSDDPSSALLVAAIDDPASAQAIAVERAFLARLEGSCRTPIAGLAKLEGGLLRFRGEILSPDGRVSCATERLGLAADGLSLAVACAEALLAAAGPAFFNDPPDARLMPA